MTLKQLYRDECDTLRLLVDVLEGAGANHILENVEVINSVQALDWDEYRKPKAIPHILRFLGASLLIQVVSLLEFRLKIIVVYLIESFGRAIPDELKGPSNRNVLDWMKQVIEQTGVTFDFGTELFRRLRAWISVRNDLVHNGGHRSERVTDEHIRILSGVQAMEFDSAYDVSFGACESAIRDVEEFFRVTERSLRSLN